VATGALPGGWCGGRKGDDRSLRRDVKATRYFQDQVLRKRPYIVVDWCAAVLARRYADRFRLTGAFVGGPGVRPARRVGAAYSVSSRWTMGKRFTMRSSTEDIARTRMKLHYYPETDSLYIELQPGPGTEVREVADGLNADMTRPEKWLVSISTMPRNGSIFQRSRPSRYPSKQPRRPEPMITALVLYDLPAHIDREACRQHFLKIAPDFLGVPGFIRKQFIHDVDGGVAGGSYIWESLPAAKAFYSGPWLEGIRARTVAPLGSPISKPSPSPTRPPMYAGPPPGPLVGATAEPERVG